VALFFAVKFVSIKFVLKYAEAYGNCCSSLKGGEPMGNINSAIAAEFHPRKFISWFYNSIKSAG